MRKIIVACCLFAVSMGAFAGSRIPLYPRQDDPLKAGSGPLHDRNTYTAKFIK